jgi:3-phosphoshikimate 1-carboxyvinyltransferase
VGLNPTRIGLLGILNRMGAAIEVIEGTSAGEPRGSIEARHADLTGTRVHADEVPLAIDELPLVALLGCFAEGRTVVSGAQELRHKESDRIAGIAAGLAALGARVKVDGDDITIHGGASLSGAATDSLDDHRLAMSFAIAGLVASGETVVGRPGSAAISYPAFFADLERVRA